MRRNMYFFSIITSVLLLSMSCSNYSRDFIGTWNRQGSQDKIEIYADGTFKAAFMITFRHEEGFMIAAMHEVDGIWRCKNHNIAVCYFAGVEKATNRTEEIPLFYLTKAKEQLMLRRGILPEIEEGLYSRTHSSER